MISVYLDLNKKGTHAAIYTNVLRSTNIPYSENTFRTNIM